MAVVAKRLAANVFMSWFANLSKVGIQLIMLPLMARLLGPAEMSVYMMALPLLSFVLLLADGGLGNSLARESRDNELVWSSAFWMLLFSGFIMALIVIAASFVIGDFSNQPRLPIIMIPLSITLVLVASSVIPGARLLQTGRVGLGAVADMVGNIMGAGIGIWVALSGGGVWAMVAQYLTTFIIRVITFSFFEPYLPKFMFSFPALKAHFGIGGAITGGRLVDFAGRALENAQINRVLGDVTLGIYGFANQVPRFLCEAASNPIWSNLYYLCLNGSPEDVSRNYVRHCRMISLVVFPAAALLAVMTPYLLPLLVGAKYNEGIFTLIVLLLTYPFITLGNQNGAVLYAKGLAGIPLWGSVALSVGRVAIVAFTAVLGLNGVALAMGVLNVVYGLVLAMVSSRETQTPTLQLLKALRGPFLAAGLASAGLYYGLHEFSVHIAELIIGGLVAAAVYAVALMIIDWRRTSEDLSVVGALLKR